MGDLIDRNDAVEAIEFEKVCITAYNGYVSEGNPLKQYNKGLDDAIKAVNSLASAEPKRKTNIKMNWATYFDNMGTAVIHIPYSYKCGKCGCQLQRTYDGIDINYCPVCGYRLEWK